MRVHGLCRAPADREHDAAFERVFATNELLAFLADLDVLVLALPLTPSTRAIIDERALAVLPTRAVVINIARGGLIDEPALERALADGALGGAVLDTFTREPLPPESPLWGLRNVTVTPHNSGAVHPHELAAICTRNLREFTRGRFAGAAGRPAAAATDGPLLTGPSRIAKLGQIVTGNVTGKECGNGCSG